MIYKEIFFAFPSLTPPAILSLFTLAEKSTGKTVEKPNKVPAFPPPTLFLRVRGTTYPFLRKFIRTVYPFYAADEMTAPDLILRFSTLILQSPPPPPALSDALGWMSNEEALGKFPTYTEKPMVDREELHANW